MCSRLHASSAEQERGIKGSGSWAENEMRITSPQSLCIPPATDSPEKHTFLTKQGRLQVSQSSSGPVEAGVSGRKLLTQRCF
jgi:hypothetical protein